MEVPDFNIRGDALMSSREQDTKSALIEAAGVLFAERGFEGASVRAIAERACANVAAIHYHHGSKDQLYAEALKTAVISMSAAGLRPWLEDDSRFQTPADCASLIRHIVRERFHTYFSPALPAWHTQLVLRSFLEPSPALQLLVRQEFEPDLDLLCAILRRACPRLGEEQAMFFAFSLIGQIAFYGFAQAPLLVLLDKAEYDPRFLDAASEHVSHTLLSSLGLPVDSPMLTW
jgi:AcrR family transcriptional regulator